MKFNKDKFNPNMVMGIYGKKMVKDPKYTVRGASRASTRPNKNNEDGVIFEY
jgi:hypothetical protein